MFIKNILLNIYFELQAATYFCMTHRQDHSGCSHLTQECQTARVQLFGRTKVEQDHG